MLKVSSIRVEFPLRILSAQREKTHIIWGYETVKLLIKVMPGNIKVLPIDYYFTTEMQCTLSGSTFTCDFTGL